MALDPRLDAVDGAQSNPLARLAAKITVLEREVAQLRAGNPVIQTFTGPPTGAPRPGVPGLQTDTPRLWLHACGGTWKYTALT